MLHGSVRHLAHRVGILAAASAVFSCGAAPDQPTEEVISTKRQAASLETEPPLLVANVISIGDAKVEAIEVLGQAYVTRLAIRSPPIEVGSRLAKGDLIELTPHSRLMLKIDGRPMELTSRGKTEWYRLE